MTQTLAGAFAAAPDAALERRTMRKVMARLAPLMAIMFLVNNLDRVNVSFAALTMNQDLGLTALSYAWGAGIFFVGYFLFEIPSNLIMERVGARLWMARIMITWGLISGATAFVVDHTSFLIVRFLLGAAEAGFVPGILLYITYWFPPRYRARAIALFLVAQPLSFAVAGALSAPLLKMDGVLGLHGWQWMFILEAVPSVLLAFVVLRVMTDKPKQAAWLTAEERDWLEREVGQPETHASPKEQLKLIANRRVALLCAIYIGRTTAMYGISLFLPLILKGMGLSNTQSGFLSVIPFAVATVGALAWGYSSDRTGERHWHTIMTMVLAAAGLFAAGLIGPSTLALVAISAAAIGLYAQPACFYALPPMMLASASTAAALAAINSVGNLGGFIGPYVVGWAQEATGSFSGGLYVLAGFAIVSGLLGVILQRLGWDRRPLEFKAA